MSQKVSIIIPVYNSENVITKTLSSAIKQTWDNIEIIVINDGSTDNSLQKIKETASSYPEVKIKIINQFNIGAAASRNKGLSESTGDFIQYLDADDIIPPDKIEKQIPYLIDNPDCIVGCNWVRFKGNIDETFGDIGPHPSIRKNLLPYDWLFQKHTMLVHGWLTPRNIIEKANGWNESLTLNDDGEFFYRVIPHCKQVLFCDQTTVFYRTEDSSSLSSIHHHTHIKIDSLFQSLLTYSDVLINLDNSIKSRERAAFELLKFYHDLYPRTRFLKDNLFSKVQSLGGAKYQYLGHSAKERVLIKLFGWKLTKTLYYHYSKAKKYLP